MTTVANIAVIVGMMLSLLGVVTILWKIAKSVTTTQISVSNIETDLTEIKMTLSNSNKRIDEIDMRSKFNERDVATSFKRIDENRDERKKDVADAKRDLVGAITEIKVNCTHIQEEKRKERLG